MKKRKIKGQPADPNVPKNKTILFVKPCKYQKLVGLNS